MSLETLEVPMMSPTRENSRQFEIIDSRQLASRLTVPESWVRNHCRSRTSSEERIPHLKFGRYIRFRWASPELNAWLAKQQRDSQ